MEKSLRTGDPVEKKPARRIMFFVTEDWYFRSHRLALAIGLRKAGFDVAVAMKVNGPIDDIQKEGIEVFSMPFERALGTIISDLRVIILIRKIVTNWKPSLVHFVSLKPIILGGCAVSFASEVVVVNAFTGLGYLFSSPSIKAKLMRRLLLFALRKLCNRPKNWIVVQNENDLGELRQSKVGIQKRAALIQGTGVDVDSCPTPEELESPFQVVLLARLLVDKGIRDFVDAAKIYCQSRSDVRWVIAGAFDPDNPGALSLKEIESWSETGVVEWVGYVEDVYSLLRRSHAVCLPSYREGLPRALLEAAACGKALIATDVPGCRAICLHNQTGILVPLRDPKAIALAVERMVQDPNFRKKCGRNGRELVRERFSPGSILNQTTNLYYKALQI